MTGAVINAAGDNFVRASFTWRLLDLLDEGLSKEEARARAEAEATDAMLRFFHHLVESA